MSEIAAGEKDQEVETKPPPAAPKPERRPEAGGASARGQSAEVHAAAADEDGDGYVVRPGDTLWAIAGEVLGDPTQWVRLYAANSDVLSNPHALRAGMTLVVPEQKAAPEPTPDEGKGQAKGGDEAPEPAGGPRTYTVKRGDTLSTIAARVLGNQSRWRDLWNANRQTVPDANRISVGQVLVLPDEAGGAKQRAEEEQQQAREDEAQAKGGGDAKGDEGADKKEPGKGDEADGGDGAPDGPRAVGTTPLERQLAAIYNTKGEMVKDEAARLGIEPGVAAAVLSVESGGTGFRNGDLVIRFEAHIFQDLTGQYVGVNHSGKQSDEYAAFEDAKRIDVEAAHDSISMGAGQIMGFNAERIGYSNAVEMYKAFEKSEAAQDVGVFEFIRTSKTLLKAARQKDWPTFARYYNGEGYAANAYDKKLAAAYAAWGKVTSRLTPNA